MKNLIKQAHDNATERGFYSMFPKNDVHEKLREEIEEFRIATPNNTFHKDSEQSEIADIIIVLLAYCKEMGYDVEKLLTEKIEFNKIREY
ncbi:MAG: hypothetical protein PF693_09875 [Spirochaetia bacterium]|nr:hypothetical protein [Spirochaetia bacterium]